MQARVWESLECECMPLERSGGGAHCSCVHSTLRRCRRPPPAMLTPQCRLRSRSCVPALRVPRQAVWQLASAGLGGRPSRLSSRVPLNGSDVY